MFSNNSERDIHLFQDGSRKEGITVGRAGGEAACSGLETGELTVDSTLSPACAAPCPGSLEQVHWTHQQFLLFIQPGCGAGLPEAWTQGLR